MSVKIKIENLYKVFGPQPKTALKMLKEGLDKEEIHQRTGMTIGVQDASFEVNTGEIFVVMGLSGSGKSTLVRMLNRLIEPTSGHVYVDGQDVATMNDEDLVKLRRKTISMVFQSFALMPHMSVLENAAFGLEMAGVDKQSRNERAMQALEQVGLEGYHNSRPDELSGGMQQRVGLARGLAVDPDVLLMDEAFSALDPLIRTEMQDELLKLQAKHKRTIVFISHDLDEAMRIGDRIAIMEGGRVVQVGTPEEILQNPADDYVRAFFRGVDPTNILTVGDIARQTQVTVIRHTGEGPRAALQRLISHDREYGYVLDTDRRFMGIVSTDTLKNLIDSGGGKDISPAFIGEARAAQAGDSMQDILPEVTARPWPIPVLGEEGKYLGVISKNQFLRTLQRNHLEEQQA
ncbi:glycine betaine/L-proline ABC transporter ATP-binding protein [Desulfuromonas versatilis]|uniref:Glycine betaine/L-proline ABC transporter ATP-binding protein n=1 Tax=Desulfuromonas versatilis TaxID=2802975 RepID=A0ABN6E3Y9_9BACT|nr:glycine betaine/L-proline ABC transporter ATP-binding protein ProV [Desulfuromonas versatilis]BCR06899.1 glycine betaine/L-proline ABC transporter ATP-binding protein [Desulfuromonas versatilis]